MWRVNVRGEVTEKVARLLDYIQQRLEDLSKAVKQVQQSLDTSTIDLNKVRLGLQAGGVSPLSVEGLLGHLAQPQTGGALARTAFPAFTDPVTQEGALFVLSGSPNLLYRVNRAHEPPTFDPIGGSGSVTSVAVSGGTTGLGVSGSPIIGAGTITLTLPTQLSIGGTQVLTTRRTGWTAPTGTPTRTGYATSTATATQVAEALKALIDDLITHGVIGT